MATDGQAGGSGQGDSGPSHVPVGWLIAVMAMAIYGLSGAWPLLFGHDLPRSAAVLIQATLVFDVVCVLWGLYLLGLAFSRSALFPRRFAIWQIAVIVWLVSREAYVLVAPDFVFSPRSLASAAGQVAIGLACIYLLRRGSGVETVFAQEGGQPAVAVSLVSGVIGFVIGAAAGCAIGLLFGSVLAEVLNVSCSEGGCGYFVLFIGAAGLLVGAIAGPIIALWLVRRSFRRRVA